MNPGVRAIVLERSHSEPTEVPFCSPLLHAVQLRSELKAVSDDGVMDLAIAAQSFLISGGSSGIGLATARLLLAEGAVVTICARDLDRLKGAARSLGSDRLCVAVADVTSARDCERAVSAAIEHGGRLDGIAAVGGRGRHGSLLDLQPQDVVDELAAKTAGLLNLLRPAHASLEETGGRVVALTAPTAFEPEPAMGAVSAARAALDNVVRCLAFDLAPRGIRINAVGVGLIDTPRQQDRFAAAAGIGGDYQEWLACEAERRGLLLPRAGTPDEVAAAIVFLLSPLTGFTTGGVLDVAGGQRSR